MDGIELRNVEKSYAVKGRQLHVLSGLSLSVPAGQTTVLVGKSGCGKTTLLRLVAGLEACDRGEILLPPRLKTAMVFQEPRLMPWLNVTRNAAFGLPRGAASKSDVREMIRVVGLEGFEKALPRQLSGGMQQRVALARALMVHPMMLLMDEPFAALDYFTRADMQREIIHLRRQMGVGILFVTHSLEEAIVLGDSIQIMSGGKITQNFSVPRTATGEVQSDCLDDLKRELMNRLEEEIRVDPGFHNII